MIEISLHLYCDRCKLPYARGMTVHEKCTASDVAAYRRRAATEGWAQRRQRPDAPSSWRREDLCPECDRAGRGHRGRPSTFAETAVPSDVAIADPGLRRAGLAGGETEWSCPSDDDDRETVEPGDARYYRRPGEGGPG